MADDPLIGKKLNNYRLDRLIGRGGMASVYYGWDTQLHRPVAIKVIDPEQHTDPSYAKRLVQEARAIAQWRHENILQVYYAGTSRGFPYFAMEYVEGEDLSSLLADYAKAGELMPHADVLRIGWAVARALDYAHEHHVIHRDVKPSNVLVSEVGRIVLADFGLALDLQQGSRGEVFGSPHYISPEQAVSSGSAVPQSDLYSLGVILYEMLTGRVPFDDPSPMAIAVQHISQPLPLPTTINPNLSIAAEAALLKALGKEPDERYRSGAAMMKALDASLADARVKIRPRVVRAKRMVSQITVAERVTQHSEQRRTRLASTAEKAPGSKKLSSQPVKPKSSTRSKPVRVRTRPPSRHSRALAPLLFVLVIVSAAALWASRPEMVAGWAEQVRAGIPIRTPESGSQALILTTSPTLAAATQPAPTIAAPTESGPYEVMLYYSAGGFYLRNPGQREIDVGPLAFEALDGSGAPAPYRFDGADWAELYPKLLPRRCDAIEISAEHLPPRPPGCLRFNAIRTRMLTSPVVFWIEREGVSEFRVLWAGEEIARCEIAAGSCPVVLPLP